MSTRFRPPFFIHVQYLSTANETLLDTAAEEVSELGRVGDFEEAEILGRKLLATFKDLPMKERKRPKLRLLVAGALARACLLDEAASLLPSGGSTFAADLPEGCSFDGSWVVSLPPGSYYLGEQHFLSSELDSMIDGESFTRGHISLQSGSLHYVAAKTAFGDGAYTDTSDRNYFVDGGFLALTSSALMQEGLKKAASSAASLERLNSAHSLLGQTITFPAPVKILFTGNTGRLGIFACTWLDPDTGETERLLIDTHLPDMESKPEDDAVLDVPVPFLQAALSMAKVKQDSKKEPGKDEQSVGLPNFMWKAISDIMLKRRSVVPSNRMNRLLLKVCLTLTMDTLSKDAEGPSATDAPSASRSSSPLHAAAEGGDVTALKALLDANASGIDDIDDEGRSACQCAAGHGKLEALELLLERGASFKAGTEAGLLALCLSAQRGNTKLVQALLQRGAAVNDVFREATPLSYAINSGPVPHVETARILLQGGARTDIKDASSAYPLHYAAQVGSFDLVRLLVEEGAASLEATLDNGSTPLYMAAEGGHLEVVRYLAARGASIEAKRTDAGMSPLFVAVQQGHLPIVQFLLLSGVKADTFRTQDGVSALYFAAAEGHSASLQLLLEGGGDVNLPIHTGKTPLCAAAERGELECVQALLAWGADTKKGSPKGFLASWFPWMYSSVWTPHALALRALGSNHEVTILLAKYPH